MHRIIIATGVFPPEQVTSALMNYDLAERLAKEYEVIVLRPFPTRPQGKIYDSIELKGVSFKQVLLNSYTCPKSSILGRFRESISFGKAVVRYVKQNDKKIDFIYNCCWQLFGVFFVAKAAKKSGIPYMVAIQDIYPESLFIGRHYPAIIKWIVMGVLKPMDAYYQKNAFRVRTITKEMAVYLSTTRRIPKEKYLIVNNWQNDDDFFVKTVETNKEKLVFAYVGSINVHSNVDFIIRAFKSAQLQDAELRIYGGGNRTEQCKTLINELKLTNVFFDMVSREQVPIVQSKADVLVLALPKGNSEFCLPSKITSYMLSGKPIIASVDLDSATSRYLKEANCGVVVEANKESSLAEAFRSFGKLDKDTLKEMGNNGKFFADNNLSREVNLKLVVDAIKEGLETRDS